MRPVPATSLGVRIAAMSRVSSRPIAGAIQPRLQPTADTGRSLAQAIGAITTMLTIDLKDLRRRHAVLRRPEDSELAEATRQAIETGERPSIQVVVVGFDGLHVHVFVPGVNGAIAHARTRRRARAIARLAVASMLRVDAYAFDLVVEGA
jgi:hypothetical protein